MRPVCTRMLPLWVLAVGSLLPSLGYAADIPAALATVLKVGPDGSGNAAASAASRELSQAPVTALPEVLQAFDNAGPLAANWLRGIAESIAARELQATGKLPTKDLEAFVLDTQRNPRARRMAYEWVLRLDPTVADRLIPGMVNDPSTEFRRDAVERLLTQGKALLAENKKDDARETYQKALEGARDEDQINDVVKQLEQFDIKVDLPRHFGFVMNWHLIGPFDNTSLKGFGVSYPPESAVDLTAKYPGQKGEVSWTQFTTDDKYGVLDLTKVSMPHKGSVTYAFNEFVSDKSQPVDIRLGTPNAFKIWVNGKLVFGREEYHRGTTLDQYRVRAELKEGPNQILVKICQNEQTEDWAQGWQFQLRVCDSTGTAILAQNRPVTTQTAAVTSGETK